MEKKEFLALIFGWHGKNKRFTQDSPIYPEVWLEYFDNIKTIKTHRVSIILTPDRKSSAHELLKALYDRLVAVSNSTRTEFKLASTGESVSASLTLTELINVVLPLTRWWQRYLFTKKGEATDDLVWLRALLDVFYGDAGKKLLVIRKANKLQSKPLLWSVNKNRTAKICISNSVPATKADASRRVFDIDGAGIAWAIIDSGIDARHPAFRKNNPQTGKPYATALGTVDNANSNNTRVVATYDFTRFTDLLAKMSDNEEVDSAMNIAKRTSSDTSDKKLSDKDIHDRLRDVQRMLKSGRMLDWDVLAPILKIAHNVRQYVPPVHGHGSHVAGIIGANAPETSTTESLIGMCPGIDLYDLRVFGEDGEGNEFNILAALQFIRWLNSKKDNLLIHGVNLSLSLVHDVMSYGCGQTPVCVLCERLVSDGIVVVAAAGNLGQTIYKGTEGDEQQGFRMMNITDPGNADGVITVGSTHRMSPHTYGVSYFSSKGPTGDGRMKPDLVAPGEKIESCWLDAATATSDGTSMAAPHVSGAAALLLAKHRELIGKPRRIKNVLCSTATDLGREKYFQGAGMVDVLRAIQSV